MAKFWVAATVDDPKVVGDATFSYRILDNENYEIDKDGGVSAVKGYVPQVGDKFTVEVTYISSKGKESKSVKTFTVKDIDGEE